MAPMVDSPSSRIGQLEVEGRLLGKTFTCAAQGKVEKAGAAYARGSLDLQLSVITIRLVVRTRMSEPRARHRAQLVEGQRLCPCPYLGPSAQPSRKTSPHSPIDFIVGPRSRTRCTLAVHSLYASSARYSPPWSPSLLPSSRCKCRRRRPTTRPPSPSPLPLSPTKST
jgi:hypothetical protein